MTQREKDGYFEAAESWIRDEMWNQSDRRPPDLHDVSAFARAYRVGAADERRKQLSVELWRTIRSLDDLPNTPDFYLFWNREEGGQQADMAWFEPVGDLSYWRDRYTAWMPIPRYDCQ